jgi:hypothetical protein
MTREVKVTHNGKVIGTAEVSDGNLVGEIELEAKDLKHIIPDRSLTESISIAFKDVEWDVDAMAPHYEIHPKGTFDA